MNRTVVASAADLRKVLQGVKPGEDVLLYVVRRGSKFWLTLRAQGAAR